MIASSPSGLVPCISLRSLVPDGTAPGRADANCCKPACIITTVGDRSSSPLGRSVATEAACIGLRVNVKRCHMTDLHSDLHMCRTMPQQILGHALVARLRLRLNKGPGNPIITRVSARVADPVCITA